MIQLAVTLIFTVSISSGELRDRQEARVDPKVGRGLQEPSYQVHRGSQAAARRKVGH